MKTPRIIITGGPCTGKSSLLKSLHQQGYRTYLEVARAEIKRQLKKGSNLVPWDDVLGFSHKVMEGQLRQYHSALSGALNFYDRGVPDLLAYLRKSAIHDEIIERQARQLQYYPTLFIAPPWQEIYAQDNERRESLSEMMDIHHHLLLIYQELNYRVLELPKASVQERLTFIFNHLPVHV